MTLIHEMRLMWQEMMMILKIKGTLGQSPEVYGEENYPIRDETMREVDIESFENLSAIHQEYLLYVRYTAILIDPFSNPDDQGAYFDFLPYHTNMLILMNKELYIYHACRVKIIIVL